MPSLTPEDTSRTRFHLGYTAVDSIPDGDEQRFILALSRIRDNQTVQYIRFMLDSLDDAFVNLMSGNLFSSQQLISGDVNRGTIVNTPDDYRAWWERYLRQTDDLALTLNVANYRRPAEAKYRFTRLGSVSVFPSVGHPSGIADSCISDRIYLSGSYA